MGCMNRADETGPQLGDSTRRPPLPDPTATGRMGLRLFLLSLSVLFAAGMVAFVVSHMWRPTDGVQSVAVPGTLWVSTLFLLLAGIAIEISARHARRARLSQVAWWLRASLALALLFTAIQVIGLQDLLQAHQLSLTTRAIIGLDGLAFCLVLLHAVHVGGGMVLLGVLNIRTATGRLSLEHLPTVRSAASYWHFLELVWLVMIGLFQLYA